MSYDVSNVMEYKNYRVMNGLSLNKPVYTTGYSHKQRFAGVTVGYHTDMLG